MNNAQKLYYYCKTCGFYTERRGEINSHIWTNHKHRMGVVTTKTELKDFGIYIKSHCEAPDYEDFVEAPTKKVAVKMFTGTMNRAIMSSPEGSRYGGLWGESDVAQHVFENSD